MRLRIVARRRMPWQCTCVRRGVRNHKKTTTTTKEGKKVQSVSVLARLLMSPGHPSEVHHDAFTTSLSHVGLGEAEAELAVACSGEGRIRQILAQITQLVLLLLLLLLPPPETIVISFACS